MIPLGFKLTGDRILIQLIEAPEHTVTQSGLTVPMFENFETDGGKPSSRVSSKRYLSKGYILDMSITAAERLPEASLDDVAFVSPQVVTPHYQFFTERNQLSEDFKGVICVSSAMVEGVLSQPINLNNENSI